MTSRQRRLLLALLLAEVVVALADAAYATLSLSGLLLVGPLAAAHYLTPGRTTFAAASALALALLLPAVEETDLPHHLVRALIVATGGLWAVVTARAHARNRGDLARMTRIAESAIIPALPAELAGVGLAAFTRSAAATARIGGDLHDAVATPTGPRLIIGDVKGHGLDAAHLSASLLGAFRRTAATAPDLAALARDLDAHLAPGLGPEDFVTVLLAEFVPGGVLLVNCGHPAPIRVDSRLRALHPPRPCRPLGLSPDPYVWRVRLLPSDRLLLFTDGLTEARDRAGAELPLDERLHAALTQATLEESLREVLGLLREHTDGSEATDDLTLILAQPAPLPVIPEAAPVADDQRRRPS
ncbi:Stage II sporulation protein E (SpoIIE) [Nonomuraea solani]|uniref:Stage II sporulation protein E (SpoIIE) n=1 Tax=Nonomuraea solani TaxID=1144553 RepID=A0A1H5TPR0_9ACTN|nr:PP2C family protein-serine/threonine phosphatase [Nonomuraea solani]SEF64740.1 Stage II sporulation protein E (SpoIIE) [Nonomuraea solani]